MSSQRTLEWLSGIVLLSFACSTDGPRPAQGESSDGGVSSSSESGVAAESDAGTMAGEGASSSDGSTGELHACASEDLPTSSALAFDGIDDHVTMGVAPELGLEQFTIEAWVRRDAAGEETSTGVGGVQLVPIAGKGRGENDDTIYNCNYTLGFSGNVLAADFEDVATGGNHPVLGTTAATWSEWHHVAATFDGATWRLYLDGVLDGQAIADATPRADSIQHFAIGTGMDSMGVGKGRLAGLVDELRVWNHARSEDEIAQSMYEVVASADGLVGRWALDQEDAGAPDSVGSASGTIEGATFVANGAVLDRGRPPTIEAIAPAVSPIPPDAAELAVEIDDADSDEFVVTFALREVTEQDDFTIVVLPDTQYYSDPDTQHGGDPQFFYDQTQWVIDNRETYNILAVIHNGDIVNHGDRAAEWVIANAAMSTLEVPQPELPDGVPYGVCPGNHDQDDGGTANSTASYNEHFGVARFAGRKYYGGHHAGDNDENWIRFDAGGLEFVVVSLQYAPTPDPAVLDWARSVFEAHPQAFGILNSHYILGARANFGPQGQAIYDALRATDNLQLMTSGHISAESQRTDVYQGNVIHSMLADYQNDGDGGAGFLRIWEFSPANNELTVRSYSPSRDEWMIDENSEFTLEVDLRGAGAEFAEVATFDPATSTVATPVPGLAPGRTYEWYATVHDCAHTARTPVYRFTTAP